LKIKIILAIWILSHVMHLPICKAQEWWFWPKYTLAQKAENYPGNRIESPVSDLQQLAAKSTPLLSMAKSLRRELLISPIL
jgi:hypothetical protein